MVLAAKGCHEKSRENKTVEMVCSVTTNVKRKEIYPTNMIRNMIVRKDATNKRPMKITEESQDLIIDKIRRRETIEFDPSRV